MRLPSLSSLLCCVTSPWSGWPSIPSALRNPPRCQWANKLNRNVSLAVSWVNIEFSCSVAADTFCLDLPSRFKIHYLWSFCVKRWMHMWSVKLFEWPKMSQTGLIIYSLYLEMNFLLICSKYVGMYLNLTPIIIHRIDHRVFKAYKAPSAVNIIWLHLWGWHLPELHFELPTQEIKFCYIPKSMKRIV